MIYSFTGMNDESLSSQSQMDFRSDVERSNPLYQVQDANAPDIALAKKIALEMIQVNGASVLIHVRTDNMDHDKVFDEDANPTYWKPISFKGFFVPNPMEYELTQWGVDCANKQEIIFALEQVVAAYPNRLFRPGDLIELPFDSKSQQKPKYFMIDNASEVGNFRYNWLYLKCSTTLIVGDTNIRPAQDIVETIEEYTDEV
ncbi:MAG: hypothetical protein M0R50_06900 [Candidatus Cloacimonetes bacterium]|jgi:hypothetical protein|nr:hypothetical protein [Candidatus Cloacimonadota bacterium]